MPEQMFTTDPANPEDASISAVKALSKASSQGQRIYHITQANQATVLPNINHDQDTIAEINAALSAGKEVITHTDHISVLEWSGAGYIIFDPQTGDGSYKIGGGINGGLYMLFAVATSALLALVVGVGGVLVSIPILAALAGTFLITAGLAVWYGPDYETYSEQIELIGTIMMITTLGAGMVAFALALGAIAAAVNVAIIATLAVTLLGMIQVITNEE